MLTACYTTLCSLFLLLDPNNPTSYYHPHCTDEDTEAQRGQVICLRFISKRARIKI